MYDALKKAGQDVAYLHQGDHVLPSGYVTGYGITANGQDFDNPLNTRLTPLPLRSGHVNESLPAVLKTTNNHD